LCSNQFWVHKNHNLILKIDLLKAYGIEVLVIFTGKETDYRNPNYFDQLKQKAEKLGIKENIKFLGFIDRED
jgi:glycosyltransferase involved in cell wall biosynthesis